MIVSKHETEKQNLYLSSKMELELYLQEHQQKQQQTYLVMIKWMEYSLLTFGFDWAFDLSNIDHDWYETEAKEWVKNHINID